MFARKKIMKYKNIILIITGVLLIVFATYKGFTDPDRKENNISVKVLFKEDVFSNHKGRVSHNGYKLVCLKDTVRFELLVDLYTYKIAEEGKRLSFNLTNVDMGIDRGHNVIYIFIGVLGLAIFFWGFACIIDDKIK